MKKEYFNAALFFLIAAVFFYLFYSLMIPFFTPIAWAGILVIVFYPLYKWLNKKLRIPWLASLFSCILIFLIIIGPSLYLFASLVNETTDLVKTINAVQGENIKKYLALDIPFVNMIKEKLSGFEGFRNVDFQSILKDTASTVTRALGAQATVLIANVSRTILYFVLTLFSMFFFFRDGHHLVEYIKKVVPLEKEKVNVLFGHMREVIEGTMYGGVVVAIIQGGLGGIMFYIFGISSPVLWGAVMAFLAILPVVGPFLVYIPAGLIVIVSGDTLNGILIIIIGSGISQVDNFIRPHLFHGKTEMHTLLLFFSIMGGIVMFGLLGIILGPLISAIFISLIKVFEIGLHPREDGG